ncbi:MAG: periplasmic heavy metal sensor [Pseudomonadota bacterium]
MVDPSSSPASGRTRTTLMVMSLCLNVGLIALILVGIGRVGGRSFAQPGVMAPAQIARALTQERREKISDIVALHRDGMREKRQAARRARQEAFRVFGAPDYSSGDFTRALDAVRMADAALEEEAVALQQDVVNVLTPAERKSIAERIKARRERLRWWRTARPNF